MWLITLLTLILPAKEITIERPFVEMEAIISHYSSVDSCHTGEDCLMANGRRAYIGAVACPRSVPLGVLIEINGQNLECADRTAKWVDGRYDVFTGYGKEARERAIELGIRKEKIKIYN